MEISYPWQPEIGEKKKNKIDRKCVWAQEIIVLKLQNISVRAVLWYRDEFFTRPRKISKRLFTSDVFGQPSHWKMYRIVVVIFFYFPFLGLKLCPVILDGLHPHHLKVKTFPFGRFILGIYRLLLGCVLKKEAVRNIVLKVK